MAQNISLWGATYSNVPAVLLPKSTSGTARFTDVTPTTATDSDVASGKIYFKSDGSQSTGTASGGGGTTMNKQAYLGKDDVVSTSYTATDLTLKVAQTGKYTVSWTGVRNTTSGTSGSRLYINSTAQTAYTTFDSTETRMQVVEMTNVSLNANDTITVYARSRSTSYRMTVANLIIIQTA